MRSSDTRTSLLLALFVTMLGACAPVEGPAERPPDRAPVEVDASLGVIRVQPGGSVAVRMVLDVDGDPEELAPVLEAAFRAAVEDFGPVQQGFRVDLGEVITSDCSSATGARIGATLADAAVSDDVVAVLGPQCTTTLLGLQGPAAAAGLVVMTPRPQELTLTESVGGVIGQDRAEGTWRTSPSLLRETRAAAEHSIEALEVTRAATVHDGSVQSAALAEAFRIHFESLGGTVVVARQVDARLTGEDEDEAAAASTALLDEIDAGDVGVIFLTMAPEALLAVNDAIGSRSRLADITRMSTSDLATAEVLGDDASFGLLLTGPMLDFPDAVSSITGMSASQTLERVRSASGSSAPAGWWAYAYDAATVLLKAIEDASLVDVDGSFVVSRAELRETLARTTIGGMTGALRCTPLGDCAAARIAVRSVEDATATTLSELPIVGVLED